MKKPVIADLTAQQRQELIWQVHESTLQDNSKELLVSAVSFCESLLEELRSSKISINKLKQLFGFHSEQLKKALQER